LKKLENVKNILSILYFSKHNSADQYLSINQLHSLTKLPESTLKGILNKLEKIRWVERKSFIPDFKGDPQSSTDYLIKIRIRISKNKVKEGWIPSKKKEEFEKDLFALKKLKKIDDLDGTKADNVITYKKKFDELDSRKKPRIKKDYSLIFKGRTKLVNSLLEKWLAKKPIFFYKILVFPYVIDQRIEGRTKLSTKEMIAKRWHDIPKKHEHFWKEASKTVKIRKKLNDIKQNRIMSLVLTKEDFENKLLEKLREAQEKNQSYVDITSGDVHRSVGGYPGKDHRMPVCCDVMKELMTGKDEIIQQPPSGMGATLVIRYHLPRL